MIEITQSAADRVTQQLANRGHGLGLRLGVRTSGCSGYAYTLDYADSVDDGDVRFDSRGITIVVAEKDLAFLKGTTLDFRRDGLNQMFTFDNPNVTDECGCGESFAVAG